VSLKLLKLPKLNRRPSHTLLFVTEVKTFRIDTDRKGQLLGDLETIELGCKSSTRLAASLSKIAEQTTPLGSKVWLLFLRLPLLFLSVPALQIQGVDEATLIQALQYESEGMTGLSSQDKQLAYHYLKTEHDMADFWAVQIEQLLLDDLIKVLKKNNARFGGLLHPGALPHALFDSKAEDWVRIEAWSNQILALYRHDDHLDMQVYSYDNKHWQVELEHWLEERIPLPETEILLNNRL
jgi:hypothetical protein